MSKKKKKKKPVNAIDQVLKATYASQEAASAAISRIDPDWKEHYEILYEPNVFRVVSKRTELPMWAVEHLQQKQRQTITQSQWI